jgi:hypothetical protein
VAGQRFSSDIPEISETGRNILTEILLKVALNTITPTLQYFKFTNVPDRKNILKVHVFISETC